MFQNNPLLAQLKQQIHDSKVRVEGVVRATDKAYGFLETDKQTYFIAPPAMKKVMHGDKITATIEKQGDKEQAEPESLIDTLLTRFIAKVRFNREGKLQVVVDHPNIKQPIGAVLPKSVEKTMKAEFQAEALQEGDWVVATLRTHPLRDERSFYAQIQAFICRADDELAPWWVTLARHEQSRYPVAGAERYELIEQKTRTDLTALHFVTIDSDTTKDMDDALYIEPLTVNGNHSGWRLSVAIADPTAYIALDSQMEKDARQRCFTNYLPGFNIPMLPRELSDELCSLVAGETRPALVCHIETDLQGNITGKPEFELADIQSKAKLVYNNVSDYLEQQPQAWQPDNAQTAEQIHRLHQFTLARNQWRKTHALLFKEQPDYYFILAENGKVQEIKAEHRRIANLIVEECMITANLCAAQFLHERAGTGIFNTHSGFDGKNLDNAREFLLANLADDTNRAELESRYSTENLSTLAGYCQMRHDIEPLDSDYLELRLRRFLTFAEFKSALAPHFGLGLTGYATWTSPIRKYSDMVNHRLIKAVLAGEPTATPDDSILARLQEARRQNRLVERDIADWLYCRYLADKVAENHEYDAEVSDISRGGLRVTLTANGASVFVPMSALHNNKDEIQVNTDELALYIQGECRYKIADNVKVKLTEVREETRSIIGNIIFAD